MKKKNMQLQTTSEITSKELQCNRQHAVTKPGNLRSLERKRKKKEKPSTTDLLPKKPRPKKKRRTSTQRPTDSQMSKHPSQICPCFQSTRTALITKELHPCHFLRPWTLMKLSTRTGPHSHDHILQPFSSYMLGTLNQNHQRSLSLNMKLRTTCQA